MGIEIRQGGEATAAAQAGAIIGSAEKRKRAEAEAFQVSQAQAARSFQAAQEQAARQWEIQKMQMRSQQDFEHELRLRQTELDKESRAMQWDVEKMELHSRIDFEAKEKERQRIKSLGAARVQAIDDAFTRGEHDKDNPQLLALREHFQYMKDTGDEAPASLMSTLKTTPTTLTPEEKFKADRIKVGLLPRATAQKPKSPLEVEESLLSTLIGADIVKAQGMADSRTTGREEATKLGLDYDKLLADRVTNLTTQPEQRGPVVAPMYALNKQTGKRIVSHDGGQTWQEVP